MTDTQLKRKALLHSPFIRLLPFLFCYILLVFLNTPSHLVGDEGRYLQFAQNLLEGHYANPGSKSLWNGPGYPLFLAPFIKIGLPTNALRYLNAFLHFLSLVLCFYTLRQYLSNKATWFTIILLGLYWMPFKDIGGILSETYTFFLISSLMYTISHLFHDLRQGKGEKKLLQSKWFWLSGICLAILTLTKVIFAYVLLILLIVLISVWIYKIIHEKWSRVEKTSQRQWEGVSMMVIALAYWCCLPYLGYTYFLTGKLFHWSDAGGMSIYWMSTPWPEEYGDWQNMNFTTSKGVVGATEKFQAHHGIFFEKIRNLDALERDAAFKAVAFKQIKEHPNKFIKNWLCNIGRMLFNYPFSYYPQSLSTYGNIVPNMFILVFILLFLLPTLRYWLHLPYEMRLLLTLISIYLVASSFVSAYPRMFYITIPIIIWWLAWMWTKLIRWNKLDIIDLA